MSDETQNNIQQPVWHIGVVFFAACFLFAALAAAVKFSVKTPAIDADRDAALAKSLAEIRQTEEVALKYPGWVDQPRGIVRLPIDMAMQIAAREWQNPDTARKDLISREEKLNAPAPKNAAPKANPFE
ncbi:MAG TPA: hypothetical protein VFV23_09455 [Verrucomicrobiae bacterium]|nr:hypothetical protein [Verrucomicrobiae bacterium]